MSPLDHPAVPPVLSVVIPVFESWQCLAACLDSVFAQVDPPFFETIVVDDGSRTPAPPDLVAMSVAKGVTWLHHEHRGISATRNHGITRARGELILFIDADCILAPDCLRTFVAFTADHPSADCYQLNVSGGGNLTGRAEHLRHAVSQECLRQPDGTIRWLNTAGFAIRSVAVPPSGRLFNESVARAEDTLLLACLIQRNALPTFVPGAVVRHCPRLSNLQYAIKGFRGEFLCGDSHRMIRRMGVPIRASGKVRRRMLRRMWAKSAEPQAGRAALMFSSVATSRSDRGTRRPAADHGTSQSNAA